ncbi:MAG: ATP-binding protein, partial [Bacillota bacterium]
MFIGRNEELDFLNKCYNSANAEFVVLYGRRRIGKTETLSEFCQNKPSLFFSCRECTDNIQLQAFSAAMLTLNLPHKQYIDTFKDWDTAFSALGDIEGASKQVIVIDEFPYMCKSNASIPSILQNLWDHKLKNSNIMLVVCGSSMSFMENEILSSKNPLYGRATGIYKMLPMPYEEAVKFFPNYSNEDKLLAYAILGGIPHYLKQFDNKLSLKDNIKSKILAKGTVLYNEVEFLLRQELRETAVYNAIIEAIALGNSVLNDIYNKTQIDKPKLSVYIKNLIDLGIVERQFPVLAKTKEQI